MNVIVNGTPHDLAAGARSPRSSRRCCRSDSGVAVAVNDEVTRQDGPGTDVTLADGDRVEILTAVQGG